jgi:hypothetical protein
MKTSRYEKTNLYDGNAVSPRIPSVFFCPIEAEGPWGLTALAPMVLPPGAKKAPQGLDYGIELEGWAGWRRNALR